jgi:hypothetical protein
MPTSPPKVATNKKDWILFGTFSTLYRKMKVEAYMLACFSLFSCLALYLALYWAPNQQ